MSAIAGIFNRNGKPADSAILTGMMDIVAHRGVDGRGVWKDGPVNLGHLMLATTPESVNDHQPLVYKDSGLTISFNGRIDNRQALFSALKGLTSIGRQMPDSAITLKAYECWGEDCAARIIGDFSFAIWDGRRQQLFCARDIKGLKPFYYHCSHSTFIFGTELRQLFQHPAVSAAVNEGMVGQFLTDIFVSKAETLYMDILRLPPAHFLLVNAKRLQIRKYWDIDPNTRIRYRRDEEYLEHFLQLFREAVDCRLRCNGHVGATLSGGLDSPLVVGMAQTLLNEKGGQERLKTFSTVFPGKGDDEIHSIKKVVDTWGVESFLCSYNHDRFRESPAWHQQVKESLELPDFPLTTVHEDLQRAAESKGVRVLLSGMGADTILCGSDYPYFELLKNLKPGRLLGELRHQVHEMGWKYGFSRLLRSLLWPGLPQSLRRRLESSRPKRVHFEFLQEEFVNKIKLDQRIRQNGCAAQFSNLATWETYQAVMSSSILIGAEADERSDAKFSLEERHPFYDRRLIEFAMAIPDLQHHRKDQNKQLIRAASRMLMPGMATERLFYPHFTSCVMDALFSEAARISLDSLAIADTGWVSETDFRRIYNELFIRYHQGEAFQDGDYHWLRQLLAVFSVNLWYSNIHGN